MKSNNNYGVLCFALANGMYIIGKYDERANNDSDTNYEINDSLQFGITEDSVSKSMQLQMAPVHMLIASDSNKKCGTIYILKEHVVFAFSPDDNLLNTYIQNTSSLIQAASIPQFRR